MSSEAQAAAAVRHSEAKRVVEAYAVQVDLRRKRWLAANNPFASKYAAMELTEATTQHDAAQQRERAAWRAWHALEPARV